jgi:hypothetical protein
MKTKSSPGLATVENTFMLSLEYAIKVYIATLLFAPGICVFLMENNVSEFVLVYILLVTLGFMFSVLVFIVFFLVVCMICWWVTSCWMRKVLISLLGLLLLTFLFYFVLHELLGDDHFFEEVIIPYMGTLLISIWFFKLG